MPSSQSDNRKAIKINLYYLLFTFFIAINIVSLRRRSRRVPIRSFSTPFFTLCLVSDDRILLKNSNEATKCQLLSLIPLANFQRLPGSSEARTKNFSERSEEKPSTSVTRNCAKTVFWLLFNHKILLWKLCFSLNL